MYRIETALKHHSSGSATGSAFPGKGNTLSGNAPPGAEGEGQVFGGVIRTIFVICMLYACKSPPNVGDRDSLRVLTLVRFAGYQYSQKTGGEVQI